MLLSRSNTVDDIVSMDERVFPIDEWCFVNVMLIERYADKAASLGWEWCMSWPGCLRLQRQRCCLCEVVVSGVRLRSRAHGPSHPFQNSCLF